jgi:hypothetical protein
MKVDEFDKTVKNIQKFKIQILPPALESGSAAQEG